MYLKMVGNSYSVPYAQKVLIYKEFSALLQYLRYSLIAFERFRSLLPYSAVLSRGWGGAGGGGGYRAPVASSDMTETAFTFKSFSLLVRCGHVRVIYHTSQLKGYVHCNVWRERVGALFRVSRRRRGARPKPTAKGRNGSSPLGICRDVNLYYSTESCMEIGPWKYSGETKLLLVQTVLKLFGGLSVCLGSWCNKTKQLLSTG